MTLSILLAAMVAGCGPSADERRDVGYDDGYAVGFNTECQIRATLVNGDWDDSAYSAGYQEGLIVGAADCRAKGGPDHWDD